MEKLIITVACDSRTSYPHNHLCPPQEDIPGVAQQYIDAVNAGAAIAHIHGRRTLEEIDPGRRPPGVAHPSRRLEAPAGRDHEQGRPDHAVRGGLARASRRRSG